ncbi:MAG: hypothetical protein CMI54_01820 [Parcubacteria group bacterium]|nr:hypothetical protein [Parcubacteria group bacterium]|tara:strand:+ start:9504 stop:9713 length:210 start_codon:yes stop_codon:yes gene_type:complete
MIKNKELGLKIAESEEEKVWENVRKEAEMLIKGSKQNVMVQTAIMEMAEKKLEQWPEKDADKKAPVGVN